MTIEELIIHGKKTLPSIEAKLLLANTLNINQLELLNHLREVVPSDKEQEYRLLIEARANNVPFQYILGTVNFYGYEFKVNKNVLIPRFETEELVEETLNFIEKNLNGKPLKVIDLGCGSGAIGITLKKKNPLLDVTLLDISDEALDVALENSRILESDVTMIKGDMLEGIIGRYDIIISNPPYIANNEEIESIVFNNEPHLALFAGDEGLDCYEKILSKAKNNLNSKFLIAFEIGYRQKEAVTAIANKYLENVKITCKKDLSGRDRMLFITNIE